MKVSEPSKETYKQWQSDPTNWKWGIFYFNKNDRRLFPPKRIPQLGWTINFANPVSVIASVVLIITIFVLSRLIAS